MNQHITISKHLGKLNDSYIKIRPHMPNVEELLNERVREKLQETEEKN